MVGVKGVMGVPEPPSERPASVRERARENAADVRAKDDVSISAEAHGAAQGAAEVARVVQLAAEEPDIRQDRVEAAKQAMEREDFKIPEVMVEVAKRLSKYMP
ncbi:MAG: flagellar biosynthesis anti-sigma factor FlgM [Candidatus Hydrogenedentes bacterium]|nr:flagellar biosynthesis anti-sigma factor FlgM [Candidatus Hydrogenedentota bacterium]